MGNLNTTCCLGCTSCNDCNTCMVSCKTCQAFCQTKQNSDNGFEFSQCVVSGEIIGPGYFTRETWNEAIKKINSIFDKGEFKNAKEYKINENSSDTHIKASEFKRVAKAANYTSDNSNIEKDEIIYGTYFTKLENAVANLEYKENQCNSCNANCDGGCNTCEDCLSSCNSCNSQCGQYCCSCNTCQGPA